MLDCRGCYNLFTLSMPGSQNRKYYIIGTHVYYILLVCHMNATSTSCSRVICRHCLLSFCLHFYCLLWTHSWRSLLLLIPLLIYFVAVPPCRGKDVLGVMKKGSFCNALAAEQEAESCHSVEIQQENTGSYKFQGVL